MVSGVLVYLVATMPIHRINKASLGQIKERMSIKDVEVIIGVPPGFYCDPSVELIHRGHAFASAEDFLRSFKGLDKEGTKWYNWISTTGMISVSTYDGFVSVWEFREVEPTTCRDWIQSWMLRWLIH